jgi:hypothetical protein
MKIAVVRDVRIKRIIRKGQNIEHWIMAGNKVLDIQKDDHNEKVY